MTGILILTHGNFGTELLKSAEMIIGRQQNVAALGLTAGMEPEEFAGKVRAELDKAPGEYIVLCDLFCGTPSNIAAMLASNYDIECISGVNMPMLIEACTMRETVNKAELTDQILKAGADGCKNIKNELNSIKRDEI